MDTHAKVLLGLSAVFLVAGGLCGCDDASTNKDFQRGAPRVHRVYSNPSGFLDGWIDDDTGCQYIGDKQPLTLRYTVDGKPWCGLPPAQMRGRPEGAQP